MNIELNDERIAEYLAGEMDAATRRQFEAQLAGDPALAREIDELTAAEDAMRALGTEQRIDAPSHDEPTTAMSRRFNAWPIARLAAAAALAFAAGWMMRSTLDQSPPPAPPGDSTSARNDAPPARGAAVQFATAYIAQQGESGLARSLSALAQLPGESPSDR